ncbi:MAG: hypothetical protein HW387_802 [Parachlamydiales bacterium]|nr:hypothetical protein [Parachlamydiales bacterium]
MSQINSTASLPDASTYIANLGSPGGSDGSNGKPSFGLGAAILALCGWIDSINDLQKSTADQTLWLAQQQQTIADNENAALAYDEGLIKNSSPDDKTLQQNINKYNTDQNRFQNNTTTAEGLSESTENEVSDLGKATTGGYQNMSSVIDIMTNLAANLR